MAELILSFLNYVVLAYLLNLHNDPCNNNHD